MLINNELLLIKNEKMKKNKITYLTVSEASKYLSLSESSIYKMTSNRKIPFYKPSGRKILFNKSDLIVWIEKSKVDPLEKQFEESLKKIT